MLVTERVRWLALRRETQIPNTIAVFDLFPVSTRKQRPAVRRSIPTSPTIRIVTPINVWFYLHLESQHGESRASDHGWISSVRLKMSRMGSVCLWMSPQLHSAQSRFQARSLRVRHSLAIHKAAGPVPGTKNKFPEQWKSGHELGES